MTASNNQQENLFEIRDVLVELAKAASDMMLAAHPTTATTGSKKNSADLVTETDRAVEKMIMTSLKTKYPACAFLGEETYKPGITLTDAPTFIVDPIDGTINFVHGQPNFCTSLGFAVNRRPVVGVILNPLLGTLYTAVKGDGASVTFLHTKDGNPVTQSLPLRAPAEPLTGLRNSLVAVEWGSDRSGNNWTVKTNTFMRLAADPELGGSMVHSLRCTGSAALNLCAVASGTVDCYWEAGCWAWDVCAGWIIVEEAGGKLVDANPSNWNPAIDGRRYLAVRGAPSGQNELVEEFWAVIGDGRFEY